MMTPKQRRLTLDLLKAVDESVERMIVSSTESDVNERCTSVVGYLFD